MADYANNREQWPDGLWEEWGNPPPDEKRCQLRIGPWNEGCGLPASYADTESGEPRCLFHYEGEDRDPGALRSALEAAVAKGANLWHANLQEADLRRANLQEARLSFANLQEADLGDANLQGAGLSLANLREAGLVDANLQEADLLLANLQEAGLMGANLQGANLSHANLQEANLYDANLQGADLRWSRLIGAVDLRGANLTDANLLGFELSPEAKLDNVNWGLAAGNKMLQDEREARAGRPHEEEDWDEDEATFAECEAVYRQIKLSYQYSGDYGRAGQFFIREMECKRAQLYLKRFLPRFWERRFWRVFFRRGWWQPRPVWNWLSRGATRALWCVSYYICQHGENPARLAGVMGLVIVLFAFIHSLVGVDGTDGKPIIAPGFAMPPRAELLGQMTKAVYFSVATFTSLGYGDMRPVQGWGQVVAMAEVSLGIILVALLVGCVIRKVSR